MRGVGGGAPEKICLFARYCQAFSLLKQKRKRGGPGSCQMFAGLDCTQVMINIVESDYKYILFHSEVCCGENVPFQLDIINKLYIKFWANIVKFEIFNSKVKLQYNNLLQ